MSLWNLAKRSLSFYWRTNLGVLLAVMVSAMVLTGALVIGDSVRYSLKSMVEARLGGTQLALIPNKRFFRAELANDIAKELDTVAAPVLQLRGLIADSDGGKRANRIEVLGVDGRFFEIGTAQNPLGNNPNQAIVLNNSLADKLGVGVGDEVLLRIEKPSLMPRDVPLTPDSDLSMAFRLVVKAIADKSDFGSFSLKANHITSLNAFVPLQWLQEQLGRSNEVNMILLAANAGDDITTEKANEAVKKCWQLADAGLELRRLKNKDMFEIRSKRVFIDESITAAANTGDESFGVLTYFVNKISSGDKAIPYSMVTAVGQPSKAGGLIPEDMRDNEILINQWLAGDLGVKEGDDIELTYFVLGSMRSLREEKTSFRIKAILSMDSPAIDPNLMPDFPGLADAENCRDWDPGIPIDLDEIRKQDEDYWQEYKGTPKAFVTLKAGQKMWANRYGNLTMIRYPSAAKVSSEFIASSFLNNVNPASIGLFFQSVRSRGIKAGDQANDFGQLFLGLSMFLIIAALILMGLLFVFGIESRREQIGMLLAVGFSPRLVRRLLLIEGSILAVLGVVVGTAAGLIYTKVMIYGLTTLWQAAVSGSSIYFYAKPSSLFEGALAAVAVSLFAIWLTLRKQVSRPARELLGGGLEQQFLTDKKVLKSRIGLYVAAAAAVGAVLLLAVTGNADSAAVAGVFFGAGALLLIAGLGLTHSLLRIIAGGWNNKMASLAGLGLRNTTRRSGRSLAVVGLLACGIFLVVAVGANRHSPLANAQERDSGTGGFTLLGESSVSILHDLSSPSGRQSMSLDDNVLEGVQIVQLRIHEGDDASCLNLNRAQMPQLLALQPERLQERGSFAFSKTIESDSGKKLWDLLNENLGDNVVPAVGDYATVYWALGKSVGDELDYVDEKGVKFRLRLVGMLKNSILQGSLIISENKFIERFPSEDGYRLLLIDASKEKTEAVTDLLSTRLRDYGLSLTPTTQRLAEFSAVENTYLSIFQLLGGLGLILGSFGLGLVVLRNVLERRGEFAMLQAVGFDKAALKRMVFYEHGGLMAGGLVCGIVAALVAVSPALKSPGAEIPYFSLMFTIAAIAVSGLVWIRVATALALRGEMLDALRNE
ncbi:MAG: ABC transporter permease [Sedimentisphaerales bacterium]|nr:ABC transporter permease [Sedimentisphaerales bacterium]